MKQASDKYTEAVERNLSHRERTLVGYGEKLSVEEIRTRLGIKKDDTSWDERIKAMIPKLRKPEKMK